MAAMLTDTAGGAPPRSGPKKMPGMRGGPPADAPKDFFPFIDQFGQYIHKDWPGKTHSVKDLAAHREAEAKDLAARPGPADWDPYGGWQAGPQLKATGFFRTAKHKGKWWLVDPAGRLFFSHGIDCVRAHISTPVDERKGWFRGLPAQDSEFGQFYSRAGRIIRDAYKGKRPLCFDLGGANLLRKYGRQWRGEFTKVTHRRLRSWGLNTIANWSDPEIYLKRKTPYVATIHSGGKLLEGSTGYWRQFWDVFDGDFQAQLRKRLAAEKGRSAGDPWCVGYFLHNEISWGNDTSLAVAALRSPPTQPAKQEFVKDLKAEYGRIEKLNAAWGTKHASWDALLKHPHAPKSLKKARTDLVAFYRKTAERYFRICRDAVKEVAPDQLYLGCRFAWVNNVAAEAGAKYCDVVSYNFYRRSVADFRFPGKADVPLIIGEFHFGALDRGMFHTGLVPVRTQADRAAAYKNYVQGALRHPSFVGCHWFKYRDQATTGRSLDGENYQIGFVDVCDTPYPETIAACREVGYNLYRIRLEAK